MFAKRQETTKFNIPIAWELISDEKTWPAVGQLLIEAIRAGWYKMTVAVVRNQKPSIYVLNFMKK